MTEIKPEQPQTKVSPKNKFKKFIASTLATTAIGTGILVAGKSDYQDAKKASDEYHNKNSLYNQAKESENRDLEIQQITKEADTGNIDLSRRLIQIAKDNEPTRQIDPSEIKKLDSDNPIHPNEIFLPKNGFIKGKIKMGFVDTQTGDFYDLNQYGIFDYEGVGDRPLWAYSQVTTPAETNPDARYKLVFYNDGENDISLIQDEKEFFTQVNNDIKSGNKGAFNIIDLNTDKKRVLDTKVPMYSYKGKEITSYNFGGYKDSKDTVVDHNDHHINEIKQHIHNLSQ